MDEDTVDCKDVQCFDEMTAVMKNKPTSSSGVPHKPETETQGRDDIPYNADVAIKSEEIDSQMDPETWAKEQVVTSSTYMDDTIKSENTDVQDKLPGREQERVEYFHCPHCEHTTHVQSDMKRHVELFHKENGSLKSPRCMCRDNQEVSPNFHLRPPQSKKKPSHCSYCGFRISQNNDLKRLGKVFFSCYHCEYNAHKKALLTKHIEAKHLKIKPFNCPHCEYKASRKVDLNRHIEGTHLKIKPFTCPHCDEYRATLKGDLNRHIEAVHLKIKLFACPHCEYRANLKGDLNRHVEAVHLKLKPFACPFCKYSTNQKYNLKVHIDGRHLKIKPFACPHCKYNTNQKYNLKVHIEGTHLKIKPFPCNYCKYRTTQKNILKKHIEVMHLK